jgi:D-galacturonate reductase
VFGVFRTKTCRHELTKAQVGTGEYTTGFVGGGASGSDKKVGVVGLTLFDLRRRGKVGNLSMVGVNGTKFPAIRKSPLLLLPST